MKVDHGVTTIELNDSELRYMKKALLLTLEMANDAMRGDSMKCALLRCGLNDLRDVSGLRDFADSLHYDL